MKRKLLFVLLSSMLAFSACGEKDDNGSNHVLESQDKQVESTGIESTEVNSEQITDNLQKEGTEENQETNSSADSQEQNAIASEEMSFEYLSKFTFEFCSGAGGWSTGFTIEKDGYFKGNFHDSDMGSTGELYPDGTLYSSVFKGHFKDLKELEPYKYEMTLADITYQDEIGDEDIFNGIKYIFSDAYGLTGTDKFYVYMPGYPVASLDEEVYFWIQWANDNEEVLTIPVIENVNEKEGIYSYVRLDILDDARMNYSSYRDSYDYYSELIQNAETQVQLNDLAKRQFEEADSGLNYLWDIVKYHTDEAGFQSILDDQRKWNTEKEAAANAEMAQYEGGSMAPMVYHMTLADWTIKRCEVLLEYIETHIE